MVEEDSVVLMSRAGEDSTTEVGVFQKSGEGIASEVSDSSKGVVVQKANDERLMKRNEASPDKPVRAIIAVPIVSMNYQVGVLEVINRMDGKVFTEDVGSALWRYLGREAGRAE